MEYIIDKKWKWVDCNLVIKRLPQKEHQQGLYQSLEAEVQLISQEPDIKNFHSDISMDKSFEFEEGKGFIWHKSWYIPQIIVKLSSKVTKMLKEQNQIKKIYCEMLSGYPFKKDQHFYLQQIRLQGQTIKQFSKKGQVSFSNIKFSETSFNKNKNKFSLILVIYTTYKQNEKSIIRSYISSSIHVDSRKQARKKISANTFIQDQISINKFQQNLEGAQKLLNQNFSYDDILTINGFIKYYTAANIRFKIKHPYYIGYHFENIFDIYYNSDQAADPINVLELIYQTQLAENQRSRMKPKPKKQMFTDNKQILKKTCPKLLTFLIKNTPKSCYLIKQQDQYNPQQQKDDSQSKYIQNQKLKQFVPGSQLEDKNQISQNQNLSPEYENNKLLNIVIQKQKLQNDESQNINLTENENRNQKASENGEQRYLSVKEQQGKDNQQNSLIIKKDTNRIQNLKQDQAIKKIYAIFQSWKYNFIHLKKSDGGLAILNKKWVLIQKNNLYQSFKEYYEKIRNRADGYQNIFINQEDHLNNKNSYLNYQLHQCIVLQNGKNKIKIQQQNQHKN